MDSENSCKDVISLCGSRVPVVLVGNKNDLHLERVVSTDQGRRVADSWKAVFLETSAKEHEVRPCSCVESSNCAYTLILYILYLLRMLLVVMLFCSKMGMKPSDVSLVELVQVFSN